jgi:hypothetical protein
VFNDRGVLTLCTIVQKIFNVRKIERRSFMIVKIFADKKLLIIKIIRNLRFIFGKWQ